MTAPDTSAVASGDRWNGVRRALLVTYSVALLWSIFVWGIPIDRLLVLAWMAVAFGLSAVGRSAGEVKQTARDWVALVAIYIAYDYSRGLADQLGVGVNYTLLQKLDRILFIDHNPNLWLQWRLYTPGDVKWYDVGGAIVYMSHFVLPVVPLAYLRVRNRTAWLQYVRRFAISLCVSVGVFIVFPAAPPWMVSQLGIGPQISRITGRGWWELNLKTISRTIDRGAAVLNPVAAMPSLHSGLALLVALWFTRNSSWRVRAAALLLPLAMAATLVYFGEHFFVDALAGWAVVLLAWWISDRWEARKGWESPSFRVSRGSAPRNDVPPTA
ncbi:MAG: phosphatase PAP2 family protein [Acidimicrobiales bacterium]